MTFTPSSTAKRALWAGLLVALGAALPAAADPVARNRCARFGEDFAAVAGSDTCMRIGGHVRVNNIGGERLPPAGYAAMQPGDGVQRAAERSSSHVRAGGPLGVLTDIFPR